jgi:hypothetical protein
MGKKTKVVLTLQQEALAHGFRTLGDVADAAGVGKSTVYFANIGVMPKGDAVKRIADALRRGPRPGPFDADDVIASIEQGRKLKEAKVREAAKT